MALTQVTPDVVHNVQSNITQVGTLSNLTVSGNISSTNLTSGQIIYTGTGGLLSGDDSLRYEGIGVLQLARDYDGGTEIQITNINGSTNAAVAIYLDADEGPSVIETRPAAGPTYGLNLPRSLYIGTQTLNGITIAAESAAPIIFGTDNIERMRISPTGNVTVTGNVSAGNVIATNFTGTASLANNASFLGGTPAASYALGSVVTTANTNMKGYVDGQISTTSSSVTTANTNMKGYVDAVTTAWTANAGAQASDIAILTSNAATQSGQIASKADLSGASFTGNVTTSANVKFTGWQIYETGTSLYFAYNGAVKMSLNTAGNLTVSGDIAGFGTP